MICCHDGARDMASQSTNLPLDRLNVMERECAICKVCVNSEELLGPGLDLFPVFSYTLPGFSYLAQEWRWGYLEPPPSRFSLISAKPMEIVARKFQHPSVC